MCNYIPKNYILQTQNSQYSQKIVFIIERTTGRQVCKECSSGNVLKKFYFLS